jgi:riboflavin kinase/FMN adenylyltransferase
VKIFDSINKFPSNVKTIVTIGTFDGVHKGHIAIINRINDIAKKNNFESVLLTFYPHPRHVLYPDDQNLKLINTIEEKIDSLKLTGLDNLIIHKFDKAFSRLKSVNFIRDILVDKLNMRYMVVGFDHQFGKNREGTFEDLIQFSDLYDFKIEKIEAQLIEGVAISSTKIRKAIKTGQIEKVNSYLSSTYSITATVVKGNNIGASIGYPTANLDILNRWKIIPKKGVYFVSVLFRNRIYFGMLNLGSRPTISDSSFVIEVHLFDFNKQIYDDTLKVNFLKRIRDEKKFLDLSKLKLQLIKDENECRTLINKFY